MYESRKRGSMALHVKEASGMDWRVDWRVVQWGEDVASWMLDRWR